MQPDPSADHGCGGQARSLSSPQSGIEKRRKRNRLRGGPVPLKGCAEGFIAVDHAFTPRGAAVALILFATASGACAQDAPVGLVPHRAVYDLSLQKTRGNSQVATVRGRIFYDFGGNACEGYSLEFRQVSEVGSGEDKDPPAICARPPGKAPTPRVSNSARRISSTTIWSTPSTATPSASPTKPRLIS